MSDAAPAAFLAAFARLPLGTFRGIYAARNYVVSRSTQTDGRSEKLVAEELGGPDYISLNLYHLTAGARLKPCEMPPVKVIAFVLGLRVQSNTRL